jgi:hypothetical protein
MRRFAPGLSKSDKAKLRLLADGATPPAKYRELMYALGEMLGQRIVRRASKKRRALIVCTAEDADYLASGIVRGLGASVWDLKLACFWNFRTRPRGANKIGLDLDVAPIIMRYEEPTPHTLDFVVVAKSVISTACVVRHNLLDLLERKSPAQIFIAAPVIYKGADVSLRHDFPTKISEKFKFVYFATDDIRDKRGFLIPGIGGDVYERLGLSGARKKGTPMPRIVNERRLNFLKGTGELLGTEREA